MSENKKTLKNHPILITCGFVIFVIIIMMPFLVKFYMHSDFNINANINVTGDHPYTITDAHIKKIVEAERYELMKVIERQKDYFMFIFTIFSLFFAIVGIATIFKRFYDKAEIEKLKIQFEEQKDELNNNNILMHGKINEIEALQAIDLTTSNLLSLAWTAIAIDDESFIKYQLEGVNKNLNSQIHTLHKKLKSIDRLEDILTYSDKFLLVGLLYSILDYKCGKSKNPNEIITNYLLNMCKIINIKFGPDLGNKFKEKLKIDDLFNVANDENSHAE